MQVSVGDLNIHEYVFAAYIPYSPAVGSHCTRPFFIRWTVTVAR